MSLPPASLGVGVFFFCKLRHQSQEKSPEVPVTRGKLDRVEKVERRF